MTRPRVNVILRLAALLVLAAPAGAQEPADADCLACHEDASLARADGRPLQPGLAGFAASVHGQARVTCVSCHADLAAAREFPHEGRLARVECSSCHEESVAQYRQGAHAAARRAQPQSLAATCTDCHGMHDVLPAKDPKSPVSHLNLPATCGRCHGDPEVIEAARIEAGNVPAAYDDSIHGLALREKGLVVAPNCNSCHRHHDVRRRTDPQSTVHRERVPETCGACHAGILRPYSASVHGTAVGGKGKPAVCTDCHSAHGIETTGVPDWRLAVMRECGTCHEESIRTYRDGFHGQATSLGFTRVAACADCHGTHDILKVSSPRSRLSGESRVKTCGQCHPSANANYVEYDPHANPVRKERNPVLYWTSVFMKGLLGFVFVFFGVHTALWAPRSYLARRDRRREEGER